MNALLVGIDCATENAKTGLALAAYRHGSVELQYVTAGARDRPAAQIAAEWLQDARQPRLVALDAPLGWPAPLSQALSAHRAGQRIDIPPDRMFQRDTDRFVRRELSKKPFEVGADRIARTAHAGLRLLGELRDRFSAPVPLLWGTPFVGIAAIEVYPAATLVAHGYRSTQYKQLDQGSQRRQIVDCLAADLGIGANRAALEADAHCLDAAVFVLAAKDFLDGRATPPEDPGLAEREGWIWIAPQLRAP